MKVSGSHCCQNEKPDLTWTTEEDSFHSDETMILLYNSFKEPVNSFQPYPTHLPRVFWSGKTTQMILGVTKAALTWKHEFLLRIESHKEQAKIN